MYTHSLIPIPKQAIGIHIHSCAHRMHDNYGYDGVLVQLWTLSLFKIKRKKNKTIIWIQKNPKKTEQKTTEKKLVVVRLVSSTNGWKSECKKPVKSWILRNNWIDMQAIASKSCTKLNKQKLKTTIPGLSSIKSLKIDETIQSIDDCKRLAVIGLNATRSMAADIKFQRQWHRLANPYPVFLA